MEMTESMFERMIKETPIETKKVVVQESTKINPMVAAMIGMMLLATVMAFAGVGVVAGAEGFLAVVMLNVVVMWCVSAVYGAIGLLGWPFAAGATIIAFVVFPGIWMIGVLGVIATAISFFIETTK